MYLNVTYLAKKKKANGTLTWQECYSEEVKLYCQNSEIKNYLKRFFNKVSISPSTVPVNVNSCFNFSNKLCSGGISYSRDNHETTKDNATAVPMCHGIYIWNTDDAGLDMAHSRSEWQSQLTVVSWHAAYRSLLRQFCWPTTDFMEPDSTRKASKRSSGYYLK